MLKRLNLKLKNKKSFTLLEMIISIGIFVLVATASSVLFNQALSAYSYTTTRMTAVREASLALDWIVRDIRPDADGTQHLIEDASSGNNQITLYAAPNRIRYILNLADSTIRRVRVDEVGPPQDLVAQNIASLTFGYFNTQNDDPRNTAQSLNTARTVEIIIETLVNGQRFRFYHVANH